jgi:hypothetical protein
VKHGLEVKKLSKAWVRPAVRRLHSGAAEFGGSANADGSGINS